MGIFPGLNGVYVKYPDALKSIDKHSSSVNEGCKKDLGKDGTLRRFSRGHFFIVRPSGHIETHSPLYTSEGAGQVLMILISWLCFALQAINPANWSKFFFCYVSFLYTQYYVVSYADTSLHQKLYF